ncbi:hypothetical protein DL769_009114 [Monosporascus sp. CRB-8-3]|nr:hypothetical protein DL769_009114 [Monosporascus sp. CRB-8-3]
MPPKYERREKTPDGTESTEIVTIQIPSGERYSAHAHLLAHHSKYFRAALNSPMTEAATLHFDLTEHATNFTVTLFVKWLYARFSLGRDPEWNDTYERLITQPVKDTLNQLCVAWLLGDYLQAVEFKNFIIAALHENLPKVNIRLHPLVSGYKPLGEVGHSSKLNHLLVVSLARSMGNIKPPATTEVDPILKALDAATKEMLLRWFVLDAQEMRQVARVRRACYQQTTSGETLNAKILDILSAIEDGEFTFSTDLEEFLDEE